MNLGQRPLLLFLRIGLSEKAVLFLLGIHVECPNSLLLH